MKVNGGCKSKCVRCGNARNWCEPSADDYGWIVKSESQIRAILKLAPLTMQQSHFVSIVFELSLPCAPKQSLYTTSFYNVNSFKASAMVDSTQSVAKEDSELVWIWIVHWIEPFDEIRARLEPPWDVRCMPVRPMVARFLVPIRPLCAMSSDERTANGNWHLASRND